MHQCHPLAQVKLRESFTMAWFQTEIQLADVSVSAEYQPNDVVFQ